MKKISVLVFCAALTSCGYTVPVAVISGKGDVMRGTATAALSGGSFQASGKMAGRETKCAGSYNSLDDSVTISMPVTCDNGKKGIVIATRDASGMSGSGRVRMTDGTEADFIFGNAAASF